MDLAMRKIFALLMLLFSSYANAADYGWSNAAIGTFPTPESACQALVAQQSGWTHTATSNIGAFSYSCEGHSVSQNRYTIIGNVVRIGDGCTAPAVVNEQGGCTTPLTCPYGQYLLNAVCSPIQCPTGTHYGRDAENTALEIHRCVADCPLNTVTEINNVTHIQVCSIKDVDTPTSDHGVTCPPNKLQIGFDGQGNAICMNAPGKDPCPRGTHNISSNPDEPNCTSNDPAPDSEIKEVKKPETTETKPDGAVEKKGVKETTYPDGSTKTETTTTTTGADGTVTTNVKTSCNREGACGGSVGGSVGGTGGSGGGGGGTGDGEGDDKPDNPVQQSGNLYSKKEKTFVQSINNFTNTVKASPFISAATSYFTVSVGGGACPTWKATVPYLNMVVDTGQFFCSSLMSSVFGIIAAGLMMAASYVAFRWAFL